MQYFIISLIAGLCLIALLLTVFFKAGKKNKKQREADLQLVQSCKDEGLLRLYEQAESENEREGIVEFIKEKLAREEQGLADSSFDIAPAGALAYNTIPQGEAAEPPEPDGNASRRSIQGISGIYAGIDAANNTVGENIGGHTAYGQPGATHMLALETVDWHAIEHDLQQRRDEEARIMAQNQQIQEVFSKIREVEERLSATPQANSKE